MSGFKVSEGVYFFLKIDQRKKVFEINKYFFLCCRNVTVMLILKSIFGGAHESSWAINRLPIWWFREWFQNNTNIHINTDL